MSTYFGHQTYDDYDEFFYTWWYSALTCPGSGAQDVDSLEVHVHTAGGYMRLGIFDTSRNFVMQGSAEITPSTGWMGHTAFTDQGGSPIGSPQLTGGVDYLLMCTGRDSGTGPPVLDHDTVTSGLALQYTWGYSDTGFPATMAAGTNKTWGIAIRCGVTAAAGGETSIPVIMAHYRHMREN